VMTHLVPPPSFLTPFPCEPLTAWEKAGSIGLVFGATGALLGRLMGSIKVRIPINGSFENFDNNRNKLERYSTKF